MLPPSMLLHRQKGYLHACILCHEVVAPQLHPLRLVKGTTHLTGLGRCFPKQPPDENLLPHEGMAE